MSKSSINKVILIGRLGQDPLLRYAQNGSAIVNFSLATTEEWKDKLGAKHDRAEWHNIVIYGKLAEVASMYLKKGSQVYIEGKLLTRKWKDKNGQDRKTTEIVVKGYGGVMQILGKNNTGSDQGSPMQYDQPPAAYDDEIF